MAGREDLNLRPPGPEPGFEGFEFLKQRQGGEVSLFRTFAKAFIGADSKNLKMRRLPGNPHYQGLVIATSKFTGEPYQRTLLVVRKDDPANSIDDLAGSTYGYMNKSCSSSYFPPAVMLNRQGKNFEQFLKIVEVPGWQNRVDAVVAKKIRSTMILEDVWKMTPTNEQTCKIIGQMDHCPPAILAVNKRLDIETVGKLREQALSYIPSWQTVYGSFRPYNYADVQSFTHYLSELPADV